MLFPAFLAGFFFPYPRQLQFVCEYNAYCSVANSTGGKKSNKEFMAKQMKFILLSLKEAYTKDCDSLLIHRIFFVF